MGYAVNNKKLNAYFWTHHIFLDKNIARKPRLRSGKKSGHELLARMDQIHTTATSTICRLRDDRVRDFRGELAYIFFLRNDEGRVSNPFPSEALYHAMLVSGIKRRLHRIARQPQLLAKLGDGHNRSITCPASNGVRHIFFSNLEHGVKIPNGAAKEIICNLRSRSIRANVSNAHSQPHSLSSLYNRFLKYRTAQQQQLLHM